MKKMIHRIPLAIAFALAAGAPLPAHAASEGDMAPADKASNDLYWQGQAALKKSDWAGALKRFVDLEALLRKNEPRNADAALYWQAYALTQARRNGEAKTMVERLHREFPGSRWGEDADGLLQQGKPGAAKAGVDGGDDELAEVAIEGLMSAPADRAIPLLKKVLQGNRSDRLKKRALFVLSQVDDGDGLDAVFDVASNSSDPSLREEAIRILGISGDDRAIARLREIYAKSNDANQKRRIIEAFLVADRKDLVLAAARDEADPAVRAQAIQTLGALDASEELRQLFATTHDADNQRAIVQALGVAGNASALAAIAGDARQGEDIRIAALQALGVAGDDGGSDALVKLYSQANSPALREAVLQGLLVSGDSQAVLDLYRKAGSVDEKKQLLRTLTTMGDDAAIDAIEAELGKPEKR